MKTLLAILFFGTLCFGQFNHTLPYLVQSNSCDGCTSVAFPVNVTSGHVIVVMEADESLASPGSDPTMSDTLTTTLTKKVTGVSGSDCFGPGGIRIYVGTATSSGADTVTSSSAATAEYITIGEFANVTSTADGTEASTWTAQTTITTGTLTTAQNGDLMIFAARNCLPVRQMIYSNDPLEQFGTGDGGDISATGWYLSGTNGAYTGVFTALGSVHSGMTAGVALKPVSSLTIATNALPNAVSGSAYNFQMKALGGSGAYSWAVSSGSLPPGLSITSGGNITGTPAGSPAGSATIQVTDGAAATATATFTMVVGTAYSTTAYVQSHTGNCNTTVSAGTVTAGNLLIVHGLGTVNGNNPFSNLTDSVGTVFVGLPGSVSQFRANAGSTGASINRFWIGFAGGSGADTITCNKTVTELGVDEFTNIQQIFDLDVKSLIRASGGTSPVTSNAVTAPVPELLYAAFSPVSDTTVVGAGTSYTLGATGANSDLITSSEYRIGAPAGSNTASFTQTNNTNGNSSLILYGFRPTTSGTAPQAGSTQIGAFLVGP